MPPRPTCHLVQDSLLAAPIVMDLVILAELVTRISLKKDGEEELRGFHPVAVLLSYLTKAPLVGGCRPRAACICARLGQAACSVLRGRLGWDPLLLLELRAALCAVCWALPASVPLPLLASSTQPHSPAFCRHPAHPANPPTHHHVPLPPLLLLPLAQVPAGTPVINALSKQRAMLENIFRACVGLPPENNMMLEFKC